MTSGPTETALQVPQSETRAAAMLWLTTILWGLSFPLLKQWDNLARSASAWSELNQSTAGGLAIGTLASASTIIALRMFLALAILSAVERSLLRAPTAREHLLGLAIGGLFWLGTTLQVLGLSWTTPAVSAFITSLASAWVPVLAFFWLRQTIAPIMVAGFAVGLTGTVVLTGFHGSFDWGAGLTLLASILFAWHVLCLDRWGKRHQSAHFTPGLLLAAGTLAVGVAVLVSVSGPGLPAYGSWLAELFRRPDAILTVALLTLCCTILPFHWMNVYQPRISPTRAALIYLAEPLFATVFSILWRLDDLTGTLILGGSLILGGNLLVETPRWWRQRRRFPHADQ